MSAYITNGFRLISRLDRDIGVLIDNCLGFLYSIDLGHGMRKEISQIESALYDMVYLGRTSAGCEFKENLFRTRILPLMKGLAPQGYYFGINLENIGLLGYWQKPDCEPGFGAHESLAAANDEQTVPNGSPPAG